MNNWHLEETYKGMITLSIEVLKILILVNGGAAVAILAFWGNAGGPSAIDLSWSLMAFAYGVCFAALAAIVAYITQNVLYLEERDRTSPDAPRRSHHLLQGGALILAFASIGAFMLGCTWAANAVGVP